MTKRPGTAKEALKKDIEFDDSEAVIQQIIANATEETGTRLSSKEALAVMKRRRGISIDTDTATEETTLGVGAMIDASRANN